jgi:tetratricopeptide (TPR) repeat protein
MPAKKSSASAADSKKSEINVAPEAIEAYERIVRAFTAAVELLHNGDLEEAKKQFEGIVADAADEPNLAERARLFARVCERRMAPPRTGSLAPDEQYLDAVVMSNRGDTEGAIRLLDALVQGDPGSAKYLYARASAHALRGNAEAAVGDLRQAINVEPRIRFQAVNDPDFEKVREEPAFIDIIEPTPTGA